MEDMFSDKSQLVVWKQSDRPLQASRVNSNIFTSAEDTLILRGRNLFGEREWYLVATLHAGTVDQFQGHPPTSRAAFLPHFRSEQRENVE